MIIRLFALISLFFSLTACAFFQPTNSHEANCRELKRQIIFNGATPNQTEAMQQRAELDKLNQSYSDHGC